MKIKVNSTDQTTTVVTLDLQIGRVMHSVNKKMLKTKDVVCTHYQKAIVNNFVLLKSDKNTILEFLSSIGQVNNQINVQIIEK
jgi:hypothetical protein